MQDQDPRSDNPTPTAKSAEESELLPKSAHEAELQRLRQFPNIPAEPDSDDNIGFGVLLSDQIQRLVTKYKMIYPFDDSSLKAASYELRVGSKYGLEGKTHDLGENQTVTIKPFDVVLIQTLETINLPPFLIARWNIRIKWAYKGLLWVGAPQVDPGFRGFLPCPLYNLSSKPVELKFGDKFAAMDFVRTTAVTPHSKAYKWAERSRIVFEDYVKDKLESALATNTARRLDEIEEITNQHKAGIASVHNALSSTQLTVQKELESAKTQFDHKSQEITDKTEAGSKAIAQRLDSFTATTFTVIAFLFAALGIALTKSPEFSFWSSSAPLAAIALWFALKAFYFARAASPGRAVSKGLWFEIIAGGLLAVAFLIIQYRGMTNNYVEWTASRDASRMTKQAVEELRSQITARKELETRIDALQAEIEALKQKPPSAQSKGIPTSK